ncbi:RHS repeat-associated core domain-containing protein [Ulvibacterium marinum]|uniref:RHS repeat-associated core domain-containing protein n=1 Tax=Ulvibacterium marinum TaxID=2419782 RepID=A0A3B0C3N5_9FLAO|nr:RHS repeat-associated core domain-containing protein [Ulvibacterium marinum]
MYNGNIAQAQWRTANTDNALKSYQYTYDALNRIAGATGLGDMSKFDLSGITYDKNGNLLSLSRLGHKSATPILNDMDDSDYGTMDALDYNYHDNQMSNRLYKVRDDGEDAYGFKDGSGDAQDYWYDANGNMTADANKEITSISYNHLNLPIQVTMAGGNIQYVYSADGTKLKKTVSSGATTEYNSGYIYENNILQGIAQSEGYIKLDNGQYSYVYQYIDHLGNVRLSYTDADGNGNIDASSEIIEENNYYPFGLRHKGYNDVISPLGNSTAQRWKYNGVEFEEALDVDLYETFARGYDPALGRFVQIDPLGELIQQINKSPYNFAWNNPILFNDPSGLCPDCPNPEDAEEGDTYTIDNGSVYVFNSGEWERQTVEELDEVIVTADGQENSTHEAAMGAAGAIVLGETIAEITLPSLAVEVSTASAASAGVASVAVVGMATPYAMLLFLASQGAPSRPSFEQAQGDMFFPLTSSGPAAFAPSTTSTAPPSVNPPAYQPLTVEEALLLSAYLNQMAAEHEKNKRKSTKGKHEKGQTRKGRDRGGEKGDAGRRPPRKRPPGWKGPWPPKN